MCDRRDDEGSLMISLSQRDSSDARLISIGKSHRTGAVVGVKSFARSHFSDLQGSCGTVNIQFLYFGTLSGGGY